MKRFILPLIIVLILSFTLIGNCWVAGYDQRIKLTTDHTKIDATLSDFPVTAFFTSSQAEEIFVEFDADEDFDRGQFALGDDTLLKAEKELFDDSASLAIYHFKVSSVSSSAGTDIYFYYDNDANHNTSYIGIIGSATGAEVWDGHFSLVHHCVDNTTSTILDSTSNNNDGTKLAANEPIEADGKVGRGQDFDGTNDEINCGTGATLNSQTGTVEAVFDYDVQTNNNDIIAKFTWVASDNNNGYLLRVAGDTLLRFVTMDNAYTWLEATVAANTKYHAAGTWNDTSNWLYVQGVQQDIDTNSILDSASAFYIGQSAEAAREFDGIISEVRMSSTNRAVAWIKGTYNTLFDTLLTYGSEESAPAGFTWNAKTISKWNEKTVSTWNGM